METLARQIEQGMHGKEWRHCAIYDRDLERLWPLNEKDRDAKIAQFATQYWIPSEVLWQRNVRRFRQIAPAKWANDGCLGNSKSVIRVYDEAGNVIETHGHAGDFKEW